MSIVFRDNKVASNYTVSGVDPLLATKPDVVSDFGFMQTVGAAFQTDNVIGSILANESANYTNDVEEGYDVFKDINGYEQYAGKFIGVRNSTRAWAIKADIDREKNNRMIIDQAGGMGVGASVVASILDPIDWLGTGIGIGLVTKGGKMAKIAAGSTGGVIATEGFLQGTQETRTAAESLMSIATAPLLSMGLVSASTTAMRMAGRNGIPAHLNANDVGDEIVEDMLKGRNPAAAPASLSLKTKNDVDVAQKSMATFIDDTTMYKEGQARSSKYGTGMDLDGTARAEASVSGVSDQAVRLQTLITPIGRMAGSASAAARKYVHAFLENGIVTKGAAAGKAKEIAVETSIHRKQTEFIVASEEMFSSNYMKAKEAGETMSEEEFGKQIGIAMSNGDMSSNAYVQSTARELRKIFDRLKKDAQEVGLLDKDLEGVTGADSYFGRVYNREAITRNSDEFRDMLQREFLEAAQVALENGKTNQIALADAGIVFSEKELTSGKVIKANTRSSINALSAVKSTKEIYDDLVEKFSSNGDIIEIIESYGKKVEKSKDKEILVEMVNDIKKTIMDDLKVTTDPNLLRQAAIRTQDNILGDGTFTPSTVSYGGVSEKLASAFKRRALTISDNVLEPYLEKDALFVARRNIMTMVPQIEVMKKQMKTIHPDFGKADLNMSPVKKAITDEYQEKLYLLDKDALADNIINGRFLTGDLDEKLGKYVADDIRSIVGDLITVNSKNQEAVMAKHKDFFEKVELTMDPETGRIGFAKADGVTDEELKASLGSLTEEFSKKTQKWSDEFKKDRDSDLNDLEATRQLLLGESRNVQDPTSFWNKSLRNLRSINYMSMLGGVTLTSATDIARHGMVNGLRGFDNFFRADLWGKYANSVGKQEMARMGVVAEMVLNKRAAEMADISEGVYQKGKLETWLNKATNGFSKWTGMSYWTDVQKNIAVASTQDIILEAAERVNKGMKLTPEEITRFAENGLDVEDLARIGNQFTKHGEMVDGKLRLSNSDKWEDFELGELYKDVLRKQADMIVISPSVGDRPLWTTHNEFAKSVAQFSTFTFAATNRQMIAGMSYSNKALLQWSLVQIGLGAMITSAKDALSGKERKWDKEGDVAENMLEIVDRSGVIPLSSYMSKAGVFAGITSRNRYEESQVIGSLFGPSVGTLERSQKITAHFFDGNLGSVMEESSKLLPYQNHPLVKLFEQAIDWERKDFRQFN